MAHFEILENYTKVPNEVFLMVKFMKPSSYIIIMHIVRKTVGFNKKSDGISISQFVEATGLSKRQIINSIAELKKLKIIKVIGQTQKNGGRSYNRYEMNFKTITTLVQNLHRGSADNAQGVVQNLHKGSADNAHTKDNNTKDNRTKEERENTFLILTPELTEKYTSSYVQSLLSSNANLKNKKAYEITLRKKIRSSNKTQLEDFDKWLLNLLASKLSNAYKGKNILFRDKHYQIKGVSDYTELTEVYDGYMFIVSISSAEDGTLTKVKTKDSESLEHFIKEGTL